MALRKRVTHREILSVAKDDKQLAKMVEQYFKQDGYRLVNGSPQITYRTVTIRHRCHLCNLRWTEKRKVGSNVELDPDVVLHHDDCSQCHIQLLKKSKCELALLVVTLARKGHNVRPKPKSDPTDVGYTVNPKAIKF